MKLVSDKIFRQFQYLAPDNIHSPDVAAIFTTRNGGVSGMTPGTEKFRSMNLQFNSTRDDFGNVAENCKIAASSQGFCADDIICLRQKHTDQIIAVDKKIAESRPHFELAEADALVTNIKGVLLSVYTADCVPILLYDSFTGSIGAVHAGWRGTFTKIAAKTVRLMSELYKTNPQNIQAAIGPAIGLCCYEVDKNFYGQFRQEYGDTIDEFFLINPSNKPKCDLKAMNKSFLCEAGLIEANIDMSELCTMCNPELFYSHRRSGIERGTMAAFIGMRDR